MANYNGTNGNDSLTGTSDNDIFNPLLGQDYVDGAGGVDTLNVDYSVFQIADFSFPSHATLGTDGFYGLIESRVGPDFVDFRNIEHLNVRLGSRSDWFILNALVPLAGQSVSIDAGGGVVDLLTLGFGLVSNVSFVVDAANNVASNLGSQFSGFEMYGLTFGGGVNHIVTGAGDDGVSVGVGTSTVSTGDGDDAFTSRGGLDSFDGGAGIDTLNLQFQDRALRTSLVYDGLASTASVAGTLSAVNVERLSAQLGVGNDIVVLRNAYNVQVAGGAGADRFQLVSTFGTLDGGAGIDSATIDFSGAITHYETDLVADGLGGITGSFGGYSSAVYVSGIEKFAVTLGDELDLVYLEAAAVTQGVKLNLSGGVGDDILHLDFSTLPSAAIATIAADGSVTFGGAILRDFSSFRFTGSAGNDKFTGAIGNVVFDGGMGNDTLKGGLGDDHLLGGEGNDRLYSTDGNDVLEGGAGNDTYYLSATSGWTQILEWSGEGIDTLYSSIDVGASEEIERIILTGSGDIAGGGGSLDNSITGNVGNNYLWGGEGKDILSGGEGFDRLDGWLGSDTLTGGLGRDWFEFNTLETSLERDYIQDFTPGTDALTFNSSVFSALSGLPFASTLPVGYFTYGTKATTADHHLIYNTANGALYYDMDGAGGQAQVVIAQLTTKPLLSATDILIF